MAARHFPVAYSVDFDPFGPPEFRAEQANYGGTGFDRGPLAPSADHVGSHVDNSASLDGLAAWGARGFLWVKIEDFLYYQGAAPATSRWRRRGFLAAASRWNGKHLPRRSM